MQAGARQFADYPEGGSNRKAMPFQTRPTGRPAYFRRTGPRCTSSYNRRCWSAVRPPAGVTAKSHKQVSAQASERQWPDLIVACEARSPPPLLLAYLSLASNPPSGPLAFYALALFFIPAFHGHGVRRLPRAQDFHPLPRLHRAHHSADASDGVLSHSWFRSLRLTFTLHLTWSPWHYSGEKEFWKPRSDPGKAGLVWRARCSRLFLRANPWFWRSGPLPPGCRLPVC